jgi:hypothetical protein
MILAAGYTGSSDVQWIGPDGEFLSWIVVNGVYRFCWDGDSWFPVTSVS